jgi:hypothetical protein
MLAGHWMLSPATSSWQMLQRPQLLRHLTPPQQRHPLRESRMQLPAGAWELAAQLHLSPQVLQTAHPRQLTSQQLQGTGRQQGLQLGPITSTRQSSCARQEICSRA